MGAGLREITRAAFLGNRGYKTLLAGVARAAT